MPKHEHEHDDGLSYLEEMVDAMKADEPPRAAFEDARRRLLTKLETLEGEKTLMKTIFGTTLQARFGRFAVTAVIAVVAAILFLRPLGTDPGTVYANVVQQFREAVTVAFNAEWRFGGHEEPTYIEMAFVPGVQRTVMQFEGAEIIQINNTETDQGIILIPAAKMYADMDLSTMPSSERERLGLLEYVTETMQSLPPEAKVLDETREHMGRTLHGFSAGNRTLWIDLDTEELVRMELELGGTHMVMSDFRLDPKELVASMFSTSPPEGFSKAVQAPLAYNVEGPAEGDLIAFLWFMAESRTDGVFPATINPLEILTLEEKGLLRIDPDADPAEVEAGGQAFARSSQLAVTFVMGMKPANDWHYVGDGVKHGAGDTPIAWWKPEGSDAYRVIWADLSVTDETNWDPQPET